MTINDYGRSGRYVVYDASIDRRILVEYYKCLGQICILELEDQGSKYFCHDYPLGETEYILGYCEVVDAEPLGYAINYDKDKHEKR